MTKTTMTNQKNGWKKVCGYDVYVEDGMVKRGITSDGQRPLYLYRKAKGGGWDSTSPMTIAAFRAGVNRETIELK